MNLLMAEHPHVLSPTLAARLGLEEALFLQQVHFRCLHGNNTRDGKRWCFDTYADWVREMPYLKNEQKVQRIVSKLEKMGVLVTTSEYNRLKIDKRKWYRVNYAHGLLQIESDPESDENGDSKMNDGDSKMNDQYTQTTTQTTAQTTAFVCAGLSPTAPLGGFAEPKAKSTTPNPANTATWNAYAAAYRQRYGVDPIRNAKVNGMVANFVKQVGERNAPPLAAWYVWHNNHWFVQRRHDFGTLLQNVQQVMTDWQRGEQMTRQRAVQTEQTQANFEAVAQSDDMAAWERWQQKHGEKA